MELGRELIALIVPLKPTRLFSRIDADCRSAADAAHRGDEVLPGDACDLGKKPRDPVRRDMIHNAVKAKAQIDACLGCRKPLANIACLKRQMNAGKLRQLAAPHARSAHLGLRDIDADCCNRGEAEGVCAVDDAAQPSARPTAEIEDPKRSGAGGAQSAQFLIEERPDPAVRVRVLSVEGVKLLRVAVGISFILLAGPL